MRISKGFFAIAVLLVAITAHARAIHYGAVSDEALLACDQLHWRGELLEATRCYEDVLDSLAEPGVRAEAAWAIGDKQTANTLFREAVRTSPDDARLRVRWGDLYADSHQDADAMSLYREALELDADDPFALLGSARVLVGGFDDAANAFLEPLLSNSQAHDGARAAAYLLVARISLENSNESSAISAMDEAEELLATGDWPPLELYGLRAAADLLNGVADSKFTTQSLEYNQHYGGIYAVPAHFHVITRRYRDAIDLYQKAVDIEPQLAYAHEALGINLLRDNQVSRARRHLESAHDLDPFSPQSVNTLRLLDSFDNFETINNPELPERGVIPIVMRLHQEESRIIAPYAIDLVRQSIEVFSKRYDFELREPVVIEMYPDHEDFAVRTAGMPGIGILGATFGYVVAMDSASARPPYEFQWGTTLWHEMAHVFTLEATEHRVPRWYSEGISVFEEWHSGPNRGVRIPLSVYVAISEDKLLPIAELDEGFVRPTYENQVIVSYMQAGLICKFIEEQHGEAALRDLLYAFGDGLATDQAVNAVFGQSPADFDNDFDDWLVREHGTIIKNLDDWQRTQQSALNMQSEGDWGAIVALAEHLLELWPAYVEPDSAWVMLARAHEENGRRPDAVAALENFWRRGGYDPQTLRQLGDWLVEAGRTTDAIAVWQSINLVDPYDQALHGDLGELLLSDNRPVEALREFEVALAQQPHDKATAYYRMASAHYALGDREATQAELLRSLEVAPNYRPAQRLLLELMSGQEPGE